jgi:hypothetical protein
MKGNSFFYELFRLIYTTLDSMQISSFLHRILCDLQCIMDKFKIIVKFRGIIKTYNGGVTDNDYFGDLGRT